MVWYGMVWYGMVWYGMVWYGMVWYGIAISALFDSQNDYPMILIRSLWIAIVFGADDNKMVTTAFTLPTHIALSCFISVYVYWYGMAPYSGLRRGYLMYTIPYHTIPYHTTPYHTIPHHTIPYRTIDNTIIY